MTAPVTTAAPAPAGIFASDAPRSKAGTPLVKIALSRSKRGGGLMETLATATKRKVALGVRPNACDTGAWRFNHRKARHEITLSPNAHKSVMPMVAAGMGAEAWLTYFGLILRHEVHHGLLTERDLNRVDRECRAIGAPFTALNIVEDIRIDEVARKTHGAYCWWKYYQPENEDAAKISEPLAWLLYFKLCEGNWSMLYPRISWTGVTAVERVVRGKKDGMGLRDSVLVLTEFALAFRDAADTMALIPLLRDLFLTFPTAKTDPSKIGGLPSGAVGHGYSGGGPATAPMPTGAVEPVSANEDYVPPADLPSHISADVLSFMGGYADSLTLSDSQWQDRYGLRNLGTIAERGRRVAARLAGLLGARGGIPNRAALDGNRLNISGAMVGDALSFRASGKRRGERPSVVVLFDQSGSMGPDWDQHGAAFMAAFLSLHQQGRLRVTCILTGGHRHAVVPENFPPQMTGRFFCAEGCESVDKTLAANKVACRAADIVLIYTDGALTDGKVNAAQWRSQGVDLIGCAVANTDWRVEAKRVDLTTHFARAIIAEDGEKLATKIVQYIAARAK